VLTGFRSRGHLAALRILEQEAAVQDEAVQGRRESLTITLNQYRAGTANYLAVVVAQATALSNERTALTVLSRRLFRQRRVDQGARRGVERCGAVSSEREPAL